MSMLAAASCSLSGCSRRLMITYGRLRPTILSLWLIPYLDLSSYDGPSQIMSSAAQAAIEPREQGVTREGVSCRTLAVLATRRSVRLPTLSSIPLTWTWLNRITKSCESISAPFWRWTMVAAFPNMAAERTLAQAWQKSQTYEALGHA